MYKFKYVILTFILDIILFFILIGSIVFGFCLGECLYNLHQHIYIKNDKIYYINNTKQNINLSNTNNRGKNNE